MSPAGYWQQLRAAVEAGADSVYFGLKHFTARAKVGFEIEELPEVFRTLHRRGVKGFVTFNTLVFEHELEEASRAIAAIAESGADALIVQDVATMQLARRIAPDIELHASTQMSVTDAAGVRFAQRLGATRVTLARELSIDELRAIREQTDCELEIFVHGALCVAYSGQCFSSEAWGGRSANRGQCAQACRLPYDMIVDGQHVPLGDARYLLSPGDLFALHQIPDILPIGISALKIEGRYKDADYVALATAAYRKAVDEAWAGLPSSITAQDELRLEQVYSRGLGAHFITGTNHQAVVSGRAPRHRGVLMGRVESVLRAAILIRPQRAHGIAPLKAGDGLVFDAADWRSPEEPEEGGRIYSVRNAPVNRDRQGAALLELSFAHGAIDPTRIRPGDLVWRTHDPDLDKAVRPYLDAKSPIRKQPVDVVVRAREGEPLIAEWSVAGTLIEVRSPEPLAAARQPIDPELIRRQFERLGNTPYELRDLRLDIDGQPFLPASMLNNLRREAVERLAAEQGSRAPRVNEPAQALASILPAEAPPHHPGPRHLHLLVRSPEQLEAALESAPASITLDYLDLYGLKPSVERVKASGIAPRVASPRVLKPGEERIAEFLLRLDCPILVRSAGLLDWLRARDNAPALTGDFSLNAANAASAVMFLDLGLQRIAPTHDLNAAQVADLARRVGGHRVEAIAYQHLPVFHTEHCVFCRFLSTGTTYKDCGRPCESHSVELRDVSGRQHPVMADVGCRNTVFGAEAQEASAHLQSWVDAGIEHYRLEFAHESAAEVRRITRAFAQTLAGAKSARQLGIELRQAAPQGTTQGSLLVPKDYLTKDYLTLPILQ